MKRFIRKTIAFSTGLLLMPTLAFAQTATGTGFQLTNSYNLPSGTILGILTNALNWLLIVFGIVGILGFVISGIIYLVSSGDENMVQRAKTAMVWSIVGVVVGLAGFVVMQAIATLLTGANTSF